MQLVIEPSSFVWIFIPIIIILVGMLCIMASILLIQKKKESANRNEFDYFSKVIHDLKTPIYAIDGFTLLTKKCLDQPKKAEDYLEKISNVSRHMLALVTDVVDLSKIHDGKLSLNSTIENLEDVLNRCLENVEPQMIKRKLHFNKHVCITHKKVIVDALHLIQILTNILSNAIKYTEAEGAISFSLFEEVKTEDTSTFIFKIKDTGYGMSDEFQKHIFEPFAQERAMAHTDVESSGLGLFIVKKLIDLMKGTIVIDSKENEGSCFTISLDLVFITEIIQK